MVSIVTNGWFSIYTQGAVTAFHQLSAPVAIDLPAAFNGKALRLMPREKLNEIITTHRNYEAFSRTTSLYKHAIAYREKRDALLAEIPNTSTPIELVTFAGPSGEMGLHLPFDTVVDLHALARGGKVIELHHDETGQTPQIRMRTPSLPSGTLKPRASFGPPKPFKIGGHA